MRAKTSAIVIGLIFIAVGLLGFVSNPIIADSHEAIFHADSTHSIVHIVSGALFLLFAFGIPRYVRSFLILFGLIYLVIGIMGMTKIADAEMTQVFGFLHVNSADNYLHICLGAVIFLAGILSPKSS
jgi:hypothetical protein